MKKTHEIDITDFKKFHIKEAFDYFVTFDFEKLKYTSNTNDINLINNTLILKNVNKYKFRGFVFSDNNDIKNIVGYIENINQLNNKLIFDIVYLKTKYGLKYFNEKNVSFDITLHNKIIELNTSGSYINGATLRTDISSLLIKKFLINLKDSNNIIIKP